MSNVMAVIYVYAIKPTLCVRQKFIDKYRANALTLRMHNSNLNNTAGLFFLIGFLMMKNIVKYQTFFGKNREDFFKRLF